MSEPAEERLFAFVQWEFARTLGPEPGRYVLRHHAGEEAHHILAIAGGQAPRRRRGGRGRRGRGAEPEALPEVEITRVTLIDTAPLLGDDAARTWLAAAAGDEAEATLAGALGHLNHAIHAWRAAAADPFAHEVETEQALVTRVGYGTGDQVAEGRWTAAEEVARGTGRRSRNAALRPQERLAALLGGRDVVLACEGLALRARLDLDHGREREAALQVHLAVEAAVAELQAWRALSSMPDRLADLDARRDALAAAANAALQGGLDDETATRVREGLERVEAALRARSAAGAF